MAQYDFPTLVATVTTGTELADFLNSWAPALESSHMGPARPTYATAGLLWIDTASASSWLLKCFDGSDDITLMTLNPVANTVSFTVSGDLLVTGKADFGGAPKGGTVGLLGNAATDPAVAVTLTNINKSAFWVNTPAGFNTSFLTFYNNSVAKFVVGPQGDLTCGIISAAGNISATGSVAVTENLLLANNKFLQGRNAANTAYVNLAYVSPSNNAIFGDSTNGNTLVDAATQVIARIAGVNKVTVTASQVAMTGTLAVTGAITASGDITAFASDTRLKDINGRINGRALDILDQWECIYYSFNALGNRFGFSAIDEVGFSAQSVKASQVGASCTALAPFDCDEQGQSKSGKGYLTVKPDRMLAVAVAAIQDLHRKVGRLETEIAALKRASL